MKKILFLFLATYSLTIAAQDKITEGIITSKQTMSSDNEQMQAQLKKMGDMQTTTYFKNDKSREELSNPLSGDIITILDSKNVLVLMDNPALGKLYMLENIKDSEEQVKDIEVVAGTKTKTILGYNCKQYIVTVKQEGVETEMYTTQDIPVKSQQISMINDKVKGFPLYVVMKINQMGSEMIVTKEVTEIKKEKVDEVKFNMTPPEGYENMAEE